jgi:aminoglycoside phosphotransferase (APT) family kinase protein
VRHRSHQLPHPWTLTVLTVTVNAVTISSEQILKALRGMWPAVDLAADPRPLTGGYWATILHLRLTGTPDSVPDDVVLRIVPHPEMGAKEFAVQAALAQAGVPTPTVHVTGPAGGPLGGAWAVMDLAPGDPLLAGLDGSAALRQLPRILARLPGQLADTMAAVHHVDPGPVVQRARAVAPTVALSLDELWPHVRAGAELTGRTDLADALDTLAEHPPAHGETVLCHGDLHPFNLLLHGDRITVLDWTGSLVAPPAYDVALTRLLLRYPPLAAPRALRPIIGTGAAVLARRFVRRYRHANPTAELTSLDWFTGLHATRVLIDLATWQNTGDPRATTHPWNLIAPGAATEVTRTLGIKLAQPQPEHRARAPRR